MKSEPIRRPEQGVAALDQQPRLLCRDLPHKTEDLDQSTMGTVTGGAILVPESPILPTLVGLNLNTRLPWTPDMSVGSLMWNAALGVAIGVGLQYGPAVASWAWDAAFDMAEAYVGGLDEVGPPVPGYPFH